MHRMIPLSLILNIAVLVPVCAGLLTDAAWARNCYGPPTPARSILLSVYLAIAAASLLLFCYPQPLPVATLLFVQVLYKLTTPFTVGSIKNPVVISNLLISAVHIATLALILTAR